jgi:hypothetical protein
MWTQCLNIINDRNKVNVYENIGNDEKIGIEALITIIWDTIL